MTVLLLVLLLAPAPDKVPPVSLALPLVFQMQLGPELQIALDGVDPAWLLARLTPMEVAAEPALGGMAVPEVRLETIPPSGSPAPVQLNRHGEPSPIGFAGSAVRLAPTIPSGAPTGVTVKPSVPSITEWMIGSLLAGDKGVAKEDGRSR